MANPLLPPEERNLTPDQVEALDKRRDLGHTFLVIAGQFAVIATILLLWIGQESTIPARDRSFLFFPVPRPCNQLVPKQLKAYSVEIADGRCFPNRTPHGDACRPPD